MTEEPANEPKIISAVTEPEPTPAPTPLAPAVQQAVPSETMTLRFQTPDQGNVEKSWTHRPLGLDYSKKAPIRIMNTKPGSNGAALGVQKDWVIIAVNGEDVIGKDFAYVDGVMRKCAAALKQA